MKTKSGKEILLEMVLTSGRTTQEILKALTWIEKHTNRLNDDNKNENI